MVAEVRVVLRTDPLGERVIVIRGDLRVAPEFQVAHQDRQVEDEQAHRRVGQEVPGLLPCRVERDADGLAVREEPDLRQLRTAVRAYRAEGGDLGIEQVAVRCGDRGHGSPFPRPASYAGPLAWAIRPWWHTAGPGSPAQSVSAW